MRLQYLLGVAAAALVIPVAASAQETTSSIRGVVTSGGAPVAGAAVTATDVNSGTKSQTTTDTSGGFTLPGLRPGGPYTVDVTSAQGNKSVTDVYTVVQQSFNLPVELAAADDAAAGGQEVVVTATAIRGAGVISAGPSTVLTQKDISKVASVNRDIRDIERRDPFASLDLSNSRAVSFAGVNPRYNHFTINGVTVGDTFGLNPDASPTGRGPIPFDAIAQVSVSIAPYDFRQGGFQGGAIDTVLLSGNNDFHGTGFYSESTDSIQGKRIGNSAAGDLRAVLPSYNSKTYGATLRGPLIKDKLFFMVSAERNTDPRPFGIASFAGIPGATAATPAINSVIANAQTLYNYNPGTFLSLNPQKDEKIVGRIDWNIATGQRLSISYINAYDSLEISQGTSSSTTTPAVGYSSDYYATTELQRAGIVQLNSDWTDNFSTEVRGIYRSNKRGQASLLGTGFAQFTTCLDPTSINSGTNGITSCTVGLPRVVYGPDISRQTNTLFTDTWDGSFLARYRAGGHEVKLFAELAENRTTNNFLQYSAGGYYFDSIADYNAKNANQLIIAVPLNGQPDGAAASFHYDNWTFGLQDDWKINDQLTFTYGVRYDLYGMRDAPVLNPYFLSRYSFPNTKTYKGLDNFQPRASFNFKATPRLTVRGGAGVFGGGSPDIYLSNSFSNTILSNRVTFTRAANAAGCTASLGTATAAVCAAALNNVNGAAVNPVVASFVTTNATALTGSNTGALDPNFHLPSVLKATLSADYTIFGFNFGADYIHTDTIHALAFTDIRKQVVGTLPDGRPRYLDRLGFTDSNYDILLTNTSRGYGNLFDVRFDKRFDFGLSFGGAYAWQSVKDLAAATSSTINSNYTNQAVADPNFPAFGDSNDETKWAFKYNVGFDHAFFGDYRTVAQLFGETRAGRNYSFTMADNITANNSPVFGVLNTANSNRYLLYVPTGTSDPIVSYDSTATQQALDTLISNSSLKDYRGQIAPRNIARSRAFTRIDIHLEQEIPTFIGKSRISLFGDIENLPNLLNHNWGGLRQLGFPYTGDVVQVQCLAVATPTGVSGAGVQTNTSAQPCAQYRYSSFRQPSENAISVNNSLYLIRVGARFTF